MNNCHIIATDAEVHLLQRDKRGYYPYSSLRELPPEWPEIAFVRRDSDYCLRDEYRRGVEFHQQDIRTELPTGPFHLILCRNLILTYFEESLQRQVLEQISPRLAEGGVLVIGRHEHLPDGVAGLQPWLPQFGIYRRSGKIEGG